MTFRRARLIEQVKCVLFTDCCFIEREPAAFNPICKGQTLPMFRVHFCPVCNGPLTPTRGSLESGFPRRLECRVHGYFREDYQQKKQLTAPTQLTDLGTSLPKSLKLPGFAITDEDLSGVGLERGTRIAKISAKSKGRTAGRGWVAPSRIKKEWPVVPAAAVIPNPEYLYFWEADLRHMYARAGQHPVLDRSKDGSETEAYRPGFWNRAVESQLIKKMAEVCRRGPEPWRLVTVEFHLHPEAEKPLSSPLEPYEWRMENWLPKHLTSTCIRCSERSTCLGLPFCRTCLAVEFANAEADLRRFVGIPWEFDGKWYSFVRQDKNGNPVGNHFTAHAYTDEGVLVRRTLQEPKLPPWDKWLAYLRRSLNEELFQRILPIYRYLRCGHSVVDIAADLGISDNTLTQRFRREADKMWKASPPTGIPLREQLSPFAARSRGTGTFPRIARNPTPFVTIDLPGETQRAFLEQESVAEQHFWKRHLRSLPSPVSIDEAILSLAEGASLPVAN